MTTDDLLQALARLRVETGSLACFGCGHEHNCSTHGCQILREAAAQLEHFTAENRALRNALATKPTKRSLYARATYLREMVKELNAQREKTEAERDALLEIVPQWISVKERLPIDRLKKYLVAFRDVGGPIVDMARYFPSDGWTCDNWDVPQKLITHWMPLPEAPEEEKT